MFRIRTFAIYQMHHCQENASKFYNEEKKNEGKLKNDDEGREKVENPKEK